MSSCLIIALPHEEHFNIPLYIEKLFPFLCGLKFIFLIPFALVMTLLVHRDWTWWGLTWSFSLWLESVAVFPQISILVKTNGFFAYTAHYLAALGSYRFFYILLWIYRYYKYQTLSIVSICSGTLQVLLYADFFWLYIKNMGKILTSELPVINTDTAEKPKETIF